MAQHREHAALPGDRLIEELQNGGTGLRPYKAPETGRRLSWWERRKQRKELEKAAAESLKPHIVHTPAKPARARE